MKQKSDFPVLAFVAALLALAFATAGTLSRVRTSLVPAPFDIAWYVLIPLGVVAELAMFSFRYREDAQTFSFGEVVLVLGVAFYLPSEVLLGQVLGLAICYVIRRLRPIRAVFNLANFVVASGITVALSRKLAGEVTDFGSLRLWFAVLFAAVVGSCVQSIGVVVVRSLSERRILYVDSLRSFMFSSVSAVVSAAMGVLSAVILHVAPGLVFLAFVPLGLLYLFSRNLVSEHNRRVNVEFLYETAQAIHGNADLESSIRLVLERARTSFRGRYAAVLLRRPDTDSWFSVSVGATASGLTTIGDAPVWVPPLKTAVHLRKRDGSASILQQFGCHDALVASLRDGDTLNGLFVVTDHAEREVGFTPQDRQLFELLAAQIGIGVANSQMERTLGALTRLEEELRHQATHDSLTGLANRELLGQVLRSRDGTDLAILLIDLDDFKTINDSLGHDAGDTVLVGVGERLRAAVRQDDLVVRLGGDEFAIVLGASSRARAEELVERLGAALAPAMTVAGREVSIRCSIGVALGTAHSSVEELLRSADVAMYEAKHHGKGQHRIFEPGMDAEAHERMKIITGLRDAIQNDELSLVFQPIVRLADRFVVAVETLVRWNHPELGALSPSRFIPFAEESGFIVDLGAWALEQSCAAVANVANNHQLVNLHVNVSPTQISAPDFVEFVQSVLQRTGLAAARLVLEVTERTALSASETLHANVRALRDLGINLALDDFGTGYSSLAVTHAFPLNLIKIDKLFVCGLGAEQDTSLVRAILAMAETLELVPVAEGIETDSQLEDLLALGCRFGQGYYFAEPVMVSRLQETFAAIQQQSEATATQFR